LLSNLYEKATISLFITKIFIYQKVSDTACQIKSIFVWAGKI